MPVVLPEDIADNIEAFGSPPEINPVAGGTCPTIPRVDPFWRQALAATYPEIDALVSDITSGGGVSSPIQEFPNTALADVEYRGIIRYRGMLNRVCLGPFHLANGMLGAGLEPGQFMTPAFSALGLWTRLVPHARPELGVPDVRPDDFNVDFLSKNTQDGAGLFWGEGFWEEAVRHAFSLLFSYSDLAARPYEGIVNPCNVSSQAVQSKIEALAVGSSRIIMGALTTDIDPDRDTCKFFRTAITVESDGPYSFRSTNVLPAFGTISFNHTNVTTPDHILVCMGTRVNAARVDYLLWWADRLLQSAYSSANAWHAFMAILCARKALGALSFLGGGLLHELVHQLTGLAGHCNTGPFLTPLDCCTDKVGFTFRGSMLALEGLPSGVNDDGGMGSQVWTDGPNPVVPLPTSNCPGWRMTAEHCGLLDHDYLVKFTYDVPIASNCDAPGILQYAQYGVQVPGLGCVPFLQGNPAFGGMQNVPPPVFVESGQPHSGLVDDASTRLPATCSGEVSGCKPTHAAGAKSTPFHPRAIGGDGAGDQSIPNLASARGKTQVPTILRALPRSAYMLHAAREPGGLSGKPRATIRRKPLQIWPDIAGLLVPRSEEYLCWDSLTTNNAIATFVPATTWMRMAGVSGVRATLEIQQRVGKIFVTAGLQATNELRSPAIQEKINIAGGTAGYGNANGRFNPSSTLTTFDWEQYEFVRLGWIVRLSSGTTRGFTHARAWLELFC